MKLFGLRDSIFRQLVLSIFRKINLGDITIKHHWIPSRKIMLHSFKHKGYWWHGKKREHETIDKFNKLINNNDTVIEIGGHIGYFSIIYSSLVGNKGKLFVFEPGANNLDYTEKNLSPLNNTFLIKKAISNENGIVTFYLEDLSGQNNSIIKDYHLLEGNIKLSGLNNIHVDSVDIPCITLDSFVKKSIEDNISFIKIDIEGAELLALQGATNVLKEHKPNMMIEVTSDAKEVYDILTNFQYSLYTPSGKKITASNNLEGNIFCLNSKKSINDFFQ